MRQTDCIMKWFRKYKSDCPLCKDTQIDTSTLKWGIKIQTLKEIRKLGRRKTCPKEIKKELDKIKKIKTQQKEKQNELKEFTKQNKEILKTHRELRRNRFKFYRRIRDSENKLLALITLNPIYIK